MVIVNVDALVRKYEPLVYSVLAKKLTAYIGDEDLVQAGRLALWRCAERYDPDRARFSTYAYKAIYHAMLKELGKRKSELSLSTSVKSKTEEVAELGELIPDIKQSLEGVELRFELEDFWKLLTPRRQEILRMKADGYTRREIAKTLGVSYDLIVKEMKEIKTQWKDFHNNIEEDNEVEN